MGSRRSNPSVKPGQKNPIDSNTIRSSSLRDCTTSLRHPRKLFRRALETLQQSDAPKLLEKDRRALVNSAVTDLLELVRSLIRDGLEPERLDLFYLLNSHNDPTPEASAEAMKAKFAAADDGLDIPASLRRAPRPLEAQ